MTSEKSPTREVLDLYRLAVEMADRISARRGAANAFFLTLHTALVGFMAILRPAAAMRDEQFLRVDSVSVVLVAVVGILLSATWWLLLRSYRDLNGAKFKVILDMEKDLSAHPFGDEWRYLKKDPVKRRFPARYAELNAVEQIIPVAFSALYIALGLRAILS